MDGKHKKSLLGHFVEVSWNDAWWDTGLVSMSKPRLFMPVVTYGLCVRDTVDVISIAHEYHCDTEEYLGVTHIPKGIVEGVVSYGRSNS